MKELYFDKKDLMYAYRKPLIAGGLGLLVLGLLPLRRDRVTERFVLEPAQRAVLRAQVPGRVVDVGAEEGQRVAAGATLVKLHDLGLQSDRARAAADYEVAAARAFDAHLRYADYGSADQTRRAAQNTLQMSRSKEQQLTVTSPIAGTVTTPRMRDLLGSYLAAGTPVAEVVDTSSVRARIFVPEHEVQKLRNIHHVSLRLDSRWGSVPGTLVSISPASQHPDEGLMEKVDYEGIKLPDFFVVTVTLTNPDGELRDGMTGTAKILGRRRSFLGVLFEPLVTAAARRLW